MRVLLLSAYHTESHRVWCEALVNGLPDYQWTLLKLPPRYFSWRIRGNAMSWFMEQQPVLNARYDLVVATSMVDLACLKGLLPSLANTPVVLYFHENQFAYPASDNQREQVSAVSAQVTSIYSALAADRLLFNSDFNRHTFFDGAKKLLKKMPDHLPAENLLKLLLEKSETLPVPIAGFESLGFPSRTSSSNKPVLVWNHRWEYDKAPDRLLLFVRALLNTKIGFTLHIVGQQFRQQPPAMAELRDTLGGHLGQFGFIDSKEEYLGLLAAADFVISTALHDFQGLSMLEAVGLGCIPLLPNRLVYPEQYPEAFLYESNLRQPENEAQSAVELLQGFLAAPEQIKSLNSVISSFYPENLIPKYRACFESVRMAR